MLSYMMPVEDKSPTVSAVTAATAARNLSLNLSAATTTTVASASASTSASAVAAAEASSTTVPPTVGVALSGSSSGPPANTSKAPKKGSGIPTRSIIKPPSTIKPQQPATQTQATTKTTTTVRRYQLISSGVGEDSIDDSIASPDNAGDHLCDERTTLLQQQHNHRHQHHHHHHPNQHDRRERQVKSDKNFNNLIVVNGNVAPNGGGGLASVLKYSNGGGRGNALTTRTGTSSSNSNSNSNSGNANGASSYNHNGYSAVNDRDEEEDEEEEEEEEEDEEEDDLQQQQQQQHRKQYLLRNNRNNQPSSGSNGGLRGPSTGTTTTTNGGGGGGVGGTGGLTILANPQQSSAAVVVQYGGVSRRGQANALNGNPGTSVPTGAAASVGLRVGPSRTTANDPEGSVEAVSEVTAANGAAMETGGTTDVSFGSDSDSVSGGALASGVVDEGGRPEATVIDGTPPVVPTDATQQGGRKLKLSKLPSKGGVALKRVSFGSSKGSMVETLVFETPTPLPEHAEREFCQSPAVLLEAGHTTVHTGAVASGGPFVHHQHHHHHLPGPPQPLHQPYQIQHTYQPYHPQHQPHHPQQYHHQPGGYYQPDGGLTGRLHDDSGIELQEEVERSKVRVTFFQSSKPQSISPPESLHQYGGQNLIHFGAGSVGEGGGGGYDNNNLALDTYITSAALNQQYDALPGHQHQQQQPQHLHPDQWNSSMAAVYGVSPSSYNRQMSTESGWDNPFRPGGDLSREADEIVNLIKGGKPITPTGEQSLVNGETNATDGSSHIEAEANAPPAVLEGAVTRAETAQLQSTQQNGTKSPHKGATAGAGSPATARNGSASEAAAVTTTVVDGGSGPGGAIGQTPISNQVIPGPQSASHVVIDEKKKKKCTCCVIQ